MAFTFEELAAWYPGKSFPQATVVFYVVQEDGRALFARGLINSFQPTVFAGQMTAYFSDRSTRVQVAGSGAYDQFFDARSNETDLVNFEFARTGPSQYRLTQTLLRWGNAVIHVDLQLAQQAKLYLGWGTTIGAGPGQALNALTIVDATPTPG